MNLLEKVQGYALSHYNDGFWSTIVECYTDEELQDEIDLSRATTLQGFIVYAAPLIEAMEDQHQDTLDDEDYTLGSCGCTDYHMADCPIRTG